MTIRPKHEVRLLRDWPQQRNPSVRFEIERVAVAVYVHRFRAALPRGISKRSDFASTRLMVLRDHSLRRPVRIHAKRDHADARVLADRIGVERLLIVLVARALDLVLARAVDADELLRLRVVGLKIVIGNRPVARFALDVAAGVVPQIGASLVKGLETKIERAKS